MKILEILTQRAVQSWKRVAKGESPLHQAVIENDLDQTFDSDLQNSTNGLGFTPLELANLLNRTTWSPRLKTTTSHAIKIVRKGESVARNYSSQEFEKLFGVPYLPYLTFTSYDLLKIVIHQCPWICRLGILGMERDDDYELYRQQILNGTVTNTTVAWISEGLGYGLFTNTDLAKGEFVGAYTGVVRPISRLRPDHNAYCLHYPTRFWSWSIYIVDASKGGNEVRFINHSDTPNLDLECLYDRGILHFFLRAKDFISRGTHLTFSYGEAFWRYREKLPGL